MLAPENPAGAVRHVPYSRAQLARLVAPQSVAVVGASPRAGSFGLRTLENLAHFKGEVYVLTKEEGGRHTPFFKGYRPQFYFRTTDVTGVVTLPADREMVMPGDRLEVVVELIQPIAMDRGLRFAIREGGRTVGAGSVTEIIK